MLCWRPSDGKLKRVCDLGISHLSADARAQPNQLGIDVGDAVTRCQFVPFERFGQIGINVAEAVFMDHTERQLRARMIPPRRRLEHHPHLRGVARYEEALIMQPCQSILRLGPVLQRRAPEPSRRPLEFSPANALPIAQHLPDTQLGVGIAPLSQRKPCRESRRVVAALIGREAVVEIGAGGIKAEGKDTTNQAGNPKVRVRRGEKSVGRTETCV
jgi:hypothetical protein